MVFLTLFVLGLGPEPALTKKTRLGTILVERKVLYSALFTNLVRWHAGAINFPPSDIILAQLACPLSDIMFCLHSEFSSVSFIILYWCTGNSLQQLSLHSI
jgi:hypothetical protein